MANVSNASVMRLNKPHAAILTHFIIAVTTGRMILDDNSMVRSMKTVFEWGKTVNKLIWLQNIVYREYQKVKCNSVDNCLTNQSEHQAVASDSDFHIDGLVLTKIFFMLTPVYMDKHIKSFKNCLPVDNQLGLSV